MSNITTYQKISMDPLCAKDEQILIEDVAHALQQVADKVVLDNYVPW